MQPVAPATSAAHRVTWRAASPRFGGGGSIGAGAASTLIHRFGGGGCAWRDVEVPLWWAGLLESRPVTKKGHLAGGGVSRVRPVFDDRNLVSAAGLVPVLQLGESAGCTACWATTNNLTPGGTPPAPHRRV